MNGLTPNYNPYYVTPTLKQGLAQKPAAQALPTTTGQPASFGFAPTTTGGVSTQAVSSQEPSRFQTNNFQLLPSQLVPQVGLPLGVKMSGYNPPGRIFNMMA